MTLCRLIKGDADLIAKQYERLLRDYKAEIISTVVIGESLLVTYNSPREEIEMRTTERKNKERKYTKLDDLADMLAARNKATEQ